MNLPPENQREADYRTAMGRFASGVCLISTVLEGRDYAMTVASVCSVSLDPLLFLVCIEKRARLHDSLVASGVAGLNVLSHDQKHLSTRFATRGRLADGDLGDVTFSRGANTNVALFEGVQAAIEGRVHSTHDAGDHTIFVIESLGAVVPDSPRKPLVHYRSGYATAAALEGEERA